MLGSAAAAGAELRIVKTECVRWASVTFTGARHVLWLEGADSAAARDWLGALAELELAVRGHVVADIAVRATASADGALRAEVEALTVEAG